MTATRSTADVFSSVFPTPNFTTPTPQATPNLSSVSFFGQSFGGFGAQNEYAQEAARATRAWSLATRYLSLESNSSQPHDPDDETVQAFVHVLGQTTTRRDLSEWYSNAIRVHFRAQLLPRLKVWNEPVPMSKAVDTLWSTVQLLQHGQCHYLQRLETLSRVQDLGFERNLAQLLATVKDSLHMLVVHAMPQQRLQKTMTKVMYDRLRASVEEGGQVQDCAQSDRCHCHIDLTSLPLRRLNEVGLGGNLGQRAFAHAVHRFLERPAIERRCFQVDWNGRSSVVNKVRLWVQENLALSIQHALSAIKGDPNFKLTPNDVDQFTTLALSNLGRLRCASLFDYIKSWPAGVGAIMDIWEYLNAGSHAQKLIVCQSFSDQVQKRLLHSGATTAEILSIYVNTIHAFKSLDSRGVLLEKVAVPIRNYIRGRDDTVGVIASSFLADVDEEGNVTSADADKVCPDITLEVAHAALEPCQDTKSLDWDDMAWMPDPIDAGPEYRSAKSEDIISYILGNLFEPEEFIKEVTNVLAQRLLHTTDSEYFKETRLVELFKTRLDPTKLQTAEVMLSDVRISAKLGRKLSPSASTPQPPITPKDIQTAIPEEGATLSTLYGRFKDRIDLAPFLAALETVAKNRNNLYFPKRTRLPSDINTRSATKQSAGEQGDELHFRAQIVSSFFWPQLRSNEFRMPQLLEPPRVRYEQGYSKLGNQQKLWFRPALARISMRLDLEDRTIEEYNVSGWRASAIDTFASQRSAADDAPAVAYDDNVGLTAAQLMEALGMEEDLVQDALNFWASKGVLYQRSPGVYAVLERLDMDVGSIQQHCQQQSDQTSAVKSHNALLLESAPMFETFIANMLRNQGPKAVAGMMGITGLMKMVLPTFTYGDGEVVMLLERMEGRGEVNRNGNLWTALK